MKRFVYCCLLLPLIMLAQGCSFNLLNIPQFFVSDYREILVERGGGEKILILDVDGMISSGDISDSIFDPQDSTVNSVAERLEKAREDKMVKAVVLRIDSPGGGVTASDVVYNEIANFKEETGIPIYVSMLDTAASGGYYIAMAGDKVYAHPTTITGSIGVLAIFLQAEELGRKIGLSAEVIKSGENKNIGSPFKDMTPEQRRILQELIDSMHSRFLNVVQKGRPDISPERIQELADGRVYSAERALETGLIDGILYMDEVIEELREDHNLYGAQVVIYRQSGREKFDSYYARAPLNRQGDQVNIGLVNAPNFIGSQTGTKFYYLWMP